MRGNPLTCQALNVFYPNLNWEWEQRPKTFLYNEDAIRILRSLNI